MSEPLALTLQQQFELERMNRIIDNTTDVVALQRLAKQLVQAWHTQKAATDWGMRQSLGGHLAAQHEQARAAAQDRLTGRVTPPRRPAQGHPAPLDVL